MALEALSRQYELDSSRERWFSDALSDMSISDLDDFFNFFMFVFGYRKHGERKDIVVETNRIEKKLHCRYVAIQSKTNIFYLNVPLSSRLNFDLDFLLEKTALMLYLVDSQRQREDLLYRWLFCDYEHGGDPNIEFLREYWFHQPDERDNASRDEIFRIAMGEAQRLVETWRSLDTRFRISHP